MELTRANIRRLLEMLDEELGSHEVIGELYLVGGAVMCLAFGARPSTRDVDALFRPTRLVRSAAKRVALQANVPEDWLNDAVKGYLSPRGDYSVYLSLDHLRVFIAAPPYMLAMKCLAARIGEEFHDIDDIRYLLRNLDVRTYDDALDIIARYYPLKRFPQKTLYLLEELLE